MILGIEKGHIKSKPMWLESIFIQIDDPQLSTTLLSSVQEISCSLIDGDGLDILAIPFFVSVVDRTIVGRNEWNDYLNYRIEFGDKTPCIVIDNIGQPDTIRHKNIHYANEQSSIITIIHKEKRRLSRFEFYYSNKYIQRVKMEIAIFWADFV